MEKRILLAEQCVDGVKKAWISLGYEVSESGAGLTKLLADEIRRNLLREKDKSAVQMVFSFDFSPALAEACFAVGLTYISWAWDCPHLTLWAKSARYPTNRIFVFDRVQYQKLLSRGFENVWYLPLSPDVEHFERVIRQDGGRSRGKFGDDVVFLGNLYNGGEHDLFDRISYLPPYAKGYLESIIEVQRKIWGADLLSDCISDDVWSILKQYVHWDLGDRYEDDVYEMMMKNILGQKIAQLERIEVCNYLAEHFQFTLYSGADTSFNPGIRNKGYANYLTEMPLIFHYSKINIHITIRSITSGVPLRVMDVLACEGFLLTNYQQEIAEYFEDGKELVIYQDFRDMYDKIAYYLEHEEERQQIAHAGYLKVKELFSYERQVGEIARVLEEQDE